MLFNPSANWALQVSQGFIKSPETTHPDENVRRTTASVQNSIPLMSPTRWVSTSLVWGMNDRGNDHREHSVLLESNLQLDKWALYGRYEWVQKITEELFVKEPEGFDHDAVFQVGGQATVYKQASALEPFYGKNPVSGQVYLRLTPGLMQMKGM